jgi:hypothetical protein
MGHPAIVMQVSGTPETKAPLPSPTLRAPALAFGLRACASFQENCFNSMENAQQKRAPISAPFPNIYECRIRGKF